MSYQQTSRIYKNIGRVLSPTVYTGHYIVCKYSVGSSDLSSATLTVDIN
jgi:hypothetical protein